mgnify:CR=1 FL=1
MLSENLASILGYPYSLRRFQSFLIGTHISFCQFLKQVKCFVESRPSGFPELHPYRKQSKMQSSLDSFLKKIIESVLEQKSKTFNCFEPIYLQA